MNIKNILYKLKFEQTISDSEREFVKRKLSNYKSDDELNQAIRAFGFAYPPSAENIKIIENFLQYKIMCHKKTLVIKKIFLHTNLIII